MKKYYYVLGLKEGASQEQIQEAYERLSKELDPANNDNQEFFVEEFKKVQEAYKALSNTSILATDKGAKQIFKKSNTTSKKNNDATKTPIAETPRKSNKLLFIILGILFLVAIALSYVFLQPIDKNSLIEENIKGDVKLLSEYSFVAIEKFGDAIKGEMKRENDETDYRSIYNEKGNIIERSSYKTDGVVKKTIYKYDGNENKIEMNDYDTNGTLGLNSTSVFDDKGNEIKSSFFIEREFLGYFNYKYDKKG
jgi:curved DNA-binding protein CbpA